uniref:Uncharacterized protein n=1 Tax=Megaselia scalaris TaxID=36166 RepID=T1GL99_MEGSC
MNDCLHCVPVAPPPSEECSYENLDTINSDTAIELLAPMPTRSL